jgi:quinohemoprotein ethanol dehydrogenase
MPEIVIHGTLVQAGMPAFPTLTSVDIEAIQAFLTNEAWDGYNEQQTAATQSSGPTQRQ